MFNILINIYFSYYFSFSLVGNFSLPAHWVRQGNKITDWIFILLLTRYGPETPLFLGEFPSTQSPISLCSSEYHECSSSDCDNGNWLSDFFEGNRQTFRNKTSIVSNVSPSLLRLLECLWETPGKFSSNWIKKNFSFRKIAFKYAILPLAFLYNSVLLSKTVNFQFLSSLFIWFPVAQSAALILKFLWKAHN